MTRHSLAAGLLSGYMPAALLVFGSLAASPYDPVSIIGAAAVTLAALALWFHLTRQGEPT